MTDFDACRRFAAVTQRIMMGRRGWDAADWRGYHEGNVAIHTWCGRTSARADHLAWDETMWAWHEAHGSVPHPGQCAGCGKPLSGSPAVMDLPDGARVHDVQDYSCLIAYGRRWRSAAAKALVNFGIKTPGGEAS